MAPVPVRKVVTSLKRTNGASTTAFTFNCEPLLKQIGLGVAVRLRMTGAPFTTTTVVEEGDPLGDEENVNINMGVNGVNFNMSVNTGTTTGTTSTTTRTTTTTTTTQGTSTPAKPVIDTKPKPTEPEVYHMPGYTGRVGCGWPMSSTEFADVKKSIEAKSFEDSKMTLAKQVGASRCFTVEQVKGLMTLFSFEDSKLDIAKYAYERTYDIDNYYKVNDAFTFESSIDDLNSYITAR